MTDHRIPTKLELCNELVAVIDAAFHVDEDDMPTTVDDLMDVEDAINDVLIEYRWRLRNQVAQ